MNKEIIEIAKNFKETPEIVHCYLKQGERLFMTTQEDLIEGILIAEDYALLKNIKLKYLVGILCLMSSEGWYPKSAGRRLREILKDLKPGKTLNILY